MTTGDSVEVNVGNLIAMISSAYVAGLNANDDQRRHINSLPAFEAACEILVIADKMFRELDLDYANIGKGEE